jgi:hypothetical protein
MSGKGSRRRRENVRAVRDNWDLIRWVKRKRRKI